jgi:thioester reductase-like protein
MQLKKMPLNANGKVNRNALPQPTSKKDSKEEVFLPNTDTERKLIVLWKDIIEIDHLGIENDFFDVGGDSLKAIFLISKIKKDFNVELPIQKLFDLRTIKQMANFIDSAKSEIQIEIAPVEEKEYYEVSSAQKRMYLLQHFDGNSISYNIPGSLIIEGNLDRAKLALAIKKLVDRHESLRTSFELLGDKVVQRIHKMIDFELECTSASEIELEAITKDFIKPFNLETYPLFRTKLIGISETKHILLMDLHHIIFDGVSLGIVMRDIALFYKDENPEPLRIQYKDFSAWQNAILKSEEYKKKANYWLEQYSDEIPVLNMPLDFSRPPVQSFEGDRIFFETDKELAEKLNVLASKSGATLFMILLAAYNVLLMRYTGQEDLAVGVPIAGRTHSGLENMVGMFVNTLAMRNKPQGDKSFEQFILDVKQNALCAYTNQEYQFEGLVEKLNIKRDMGRNPIFDTMFVLQSMNTSQIEIDNLKMTVEPLDFKISKFDFTLQAQEFDGKINFDIEYCNKLFKKDTMERFAGHFINLLNDIAISPNKKLSELEIMSEEEKNNIFIKRKRYELSKSENSIDVIKNVFDKNKLINSEISNYSLLDTGRKNEIRRKLFNILEDVLDLDFIDDNSNFFELGGDSLGVMRVLAATFQYGWKLEMQDFYRLKNIKEIYMKIIGVETDRLNDEIQNLEYETNINEFNNSITNADNKKIPKSILLTGSTGFLGMHILQKLLEEKDLKVYCLVREKNYQHALKKIIDRMNYYFGDSFNSIINNRLFVILGDVSYEKFDLCDEKYFDLGKKVDTIIHSAAIVKHFGLYPDFEKVNVFGTKNVLEFAEKFKKKIFHISTMSVFGEDAIPQNENNIYSESDFFIGQDYTKNVYIRSKFEAEKMVLKGIKDGIDAYILRIGNLTGRYTDGKFQFNSDENRFYNAIKSILKIGVISDELLDHKLEFTPVDICSGAIFKIVMNSVGKKRVYHLFNHNLISIKDFNDLLLEQGFKLSVLNRIEFVNLLKNTSTDSERRNLLLGLVNEWDSDTGFFREEAVKVTSNITRDFLNKNGFEWPIIEAGYIEKVFSGFNIREKPIMQLNIKRIKGRV